MCDKSKTLLDYVKFLDKYIPEWFETINAPCSFLLRPKGLRQNFTIFAKLLNTIFNIEHRIKILSYYPSSINPNSKEKGDRCSHWSKNQATSQCFILKVGSLGFQPLLQGEE
ncbi:ALI_collapsed_G0025330.mRNA.1.CDS.1 [Saccharomyces cerevisiae]|nr:ALI_collapsed_G0025330.mRNA.1.CDS.1 [Saccharomyces cerevisiae]